MKLPVSPVVLAGLSLAATASGQVLFDGHLGTLPAAQGWSYAALPGLAQQKQTGTAVRLTTTAANVENAGYARVATTPLNLDAGFSVALRLQLAAETHARAERAGFSLIVLSHDQRGLELGFWTNLVFAQADQPLFTHAEDASFDFAADATEVVLAFRGTHYTLFAKGTPILSGPVRNYTAFTGFPDVYETPDFLFLGDDTTSAAADVTIQSVALVLPPSVQAPAPGVLQWTGVPGQTYTVEASDDLQSWTKLASVTSATQQFGYTNAPAGAARFFRVAFP